MNDKEHSIFDGFETDEDTGEVLIPPATVGVAPDDEHNTPEQLTDDMVTADFDMDAITGIESSAVEEDELPELNLDFEFGEEELIDPAESEKEEEEILKSIDEALAEQMDVDVIMEEPEKQPRKKKGFFKRLPVWLRVVLIVLSTLLVLCAFLLGTKPGRRFGYFVISEFIGGKVTRPQEVTPTPPGKVTPIPVTPEPTKPGTTPVPSTAPPTLMPTFAPRQEEYCYNFLLIGEENIFEGVRSDSMILVSVDTKRNKIHMCSLLRDMYVQIPGGYFDNKLNASYAYGGAKLLVDTVELNMQIKIDGYVVVNFDNFEAIIDRLGGVELTLTAEEAEYLRKTRYITKPEYRDVVAGTQLMNGNQVLGFCRVRKVPTINGTQSDYGRTERQRTVLSKLFDRYKQQNIFDLFDIMNDCLPLVTTDISTKDIRELLEMVVENKIFSMDTMKLPIGGTFEDIYVNGIGEVLAVKWSRNIEALHEFIFGPEE